jgi:beta-hydroxylase
MAQSVRDKVGEALLEVGARILQLLEWFVVRSSLVPTTPFLPVGSFLWAADLEESWKVIRTELDDVLRYRDDLPNFQDISTDQESITDDDRWKTYFFFGYGFRSDANCARCPETTHLLEAVPGMTTAFFSILSPHKRIPPHRGPYKGVVRYHLGLVVPEPRDACGIRVGGEVAHWDEGKSLVFDDSYEHEAWNDTDGVRVVLFMDVIRPLRFPASLLNSMVIKAISISPFVQDAKRRHLSWEQRFETLRAQRGERAS